MKKPTVKTDGPSAARDLAAPLALALAETPNVEVLLKNLQGATARYDELKSKALSSAAIEAAKNRLAVAKRSFGEISARHEVGRATDDELTAAKREKADAQDALDTMPSRLRVFYEEAEAAHQVMSARYDALWQALEPWREGVLNAAKELEALGGALVYAAAIGRSLASENYRYPGDYTTFLAALPTATESFGGGWQQREAYLVQVHADPLAARTAASLRDASRRLSEVIPEPGDFTFGGTTMRRPGNFGEDCGDPGLERGTVERFHTSSSPSAETLRATQSPVAGE